MLAIYAKCMVLESNAAQFMELAQNLVAETRKEEGNISYDLVRGTDNRTLFAFVEKWTDQEALNAHMASSHFTTIFPKLQELTIGEPELQLHEVVI